MPPDREGPGPARTRPGGAEGLPYPEGQRSAPAGTARNAAPPAGPPEAADHGPVPSGTGREHSGIGEIRLLTGAGRGRPGQPRRLD